MRALLPWLALAWLALAGCTPVAVPAQPMPNAQCRTGAAAALLGRPFTDALAADARKRVGAASVRVIRPGMAVTMDYRSDRLNIELDARGVVMRFRCG